MADAKDRARGQTVELNIVSHPANLAEARRAVEALAEESGFDQTSRGEIGLCVNEALANVIRHAYRGQTDQPILIRAENGGEGMQIAIRDWGSGVNPADSMEARRDPLKPGGVGMVCLRELMDSAEFVPQPDGMLLVMKRRLSHGRQETARTTG